MFEVVEIKEVKENIGSLVRAARKQNGMSQTELSEQLSFSRTTIQNLESGKNFTIDTLLKVVKELDLLEKLNTQVQQAKEDLFVAKSLY